MMNDKLMMKFLDEITTEKSETFEKSSLTLTRGTQLQFHSEFHIRETGKPNSSTWIQEGVKMFVILLFYFCLLCFHFLLKKYSFDCFLIVEVSCIGNTFGARQATRYLLLLCKYPPPVYETLTRQLPCISCCSCDVP